MARLVKISAKTFAHVQLSSFLSATGGFASDLQSSFGLMTE